MQRQDSLSRKALLVVSFGTTHEDTRHRTIDAAEAALAQAFPDRKLYRGWTSRVIVKRLSERGIAVDTLEEAIARMQAEGMTDILVQPTHMIPGAENDRMLEALVRVQAAQAQTDGGFETIRTGLPLLAGAEDLKELAQILAAEHLTEDGACLVLMGHGSSKKPEANQVYADMEGAFREIGVGNAFVATVEGTPTLDDVMDRLPAETKQVILTPLMIVAGDHARNDMAGPEEDSWKSRLEAAGFQVKPVLRGLGEYSAVREMLVRHAAEAAELEA